MTFRRLLVIIAAPGTLAAQSSSPSGSVAAARDSAPTPRALDLSGEVRTRSELDRRPGASPTDGFTALRSRLAARATLGGGMRLVVGVQGNRVLAAEGAPGEGDAIDLYEGYLEAAGAWRGAQVAVRAGRQELGIGNERLIGRRNWSVERFSFDGVRLLMGPSDAKRAASAWSATAFAITPAVHAQGAPLVPDHRIGGLHAVRPFGVATAEATLVHDRGLTARGRAITGRTTLAGRLRSARVPGVALDVEGAVQTGAQRAAAGPHETIRAWMLGARVATAARPGRRATAGLGLDVMSGDAPASPTRDGAFDTLYGSNHGFYGLSDVAAGNPASTLRGRGLVDAFATTTLSATRWLSLRTDVHRMTPARGGGVLGWELDVVPSVRVRPGLNVEGGYTAFHVAAAGAAVGLGESGRVRGRSYLQVTASF
ncbi:MAG: alginate export family protein [Gemmatirosa sp.]